MLDFTSTKTSAPTILLSEGPRCWSIDCKKEKCWSRGSNSGAPFRYTELGVRRSLYRLLYGRSSHQDDSLIEVSEFFTRFRFLLQIGRAHV